MKKILILGAGIIQVPIIQKVKRQGCYTIVADFNPEAPGLKYADKSFLASTIDKEAILEIAKKEDIDGILTTSDYPVNVVAYVARIMKLPAMSEKVAEICTNKYLQRELFLKANINTPFFRLCDEFQDLSIFREFPYVVKPVDSSASRGVKKVFDSNELVIAFCEAMQYSKSKKVLIESFIEGREFSVEAISQNGVTTIINITEKLVKGAEQGYFVEDTHIVPARLLDFEKQLIEREVLNAINLVGLDNCPSHTEVKLNKNGAHIVEIACRLGGDYITSDLVPLSTGIDMLDNLIKLAIGEPINVNRKKNRISIIQFLNQDNYFNCLDFIKHNKKRILKYEVESKHSRPIKSSIDRMGYIIMELNNYEELEEIKTKI